MWIFKQKSGDLYHADLFSVLLAHGYSGSPEHKNNPLSQQVQGAGPIPRGVYWIGEPRDTPLHGPFVLPLIAVNGTNLFGRSGFLIHGDSREHPGTASHGCIILDRATRERIHESKDGLLIVVSGLNDEVFA